MEQNLPKRAETRFQSKTIGRRQGKTFKRNQIPFESSNQVFSNVEKSSPTTLTKILKNNQSAVSNVSSRTLNLQVQGSIEYSRQTLLNLVSQISSQNAEHRQEALSRLEEICSPFSTIDPLLYSNNLLIALTDQIITSKSEQLLSFTFLHSEILFRNCSASTLQFMFQRMKDLVSSNGKDSSIVALILIKTLTAFPDRLNLSWRELLEILKTVLREFDSNNDLIELQCKVLDHLIEFLQTLSLYRDVAMCESFSNVFGSQIYELLMTLLSNPVMGTRVISNGYNALRHLLPFIPQVIASESCPQKLVHLFQRDLLCVSRPSGGNKVSSNEPRTRDQIIREIVTTEETYLRSLSTIIEHYVLPLRKLKIISQEVLSNLFSNIEMITDFHKLFLDHLKKSKSSIPSIFLQYADWLKIYTTFVNHYQVSIETLCILKNHSTFQDFLYQNSDEGEAALMSLMIQPVQRIPRYLLLLRELNKCTSDDHEEYWDLQEAIGKVEDIASHVNMSKKRAEEFTKLVNIQNKINARFVSMKNFIFKGSSDKRLSLIKPNRFLVREGTIMMRSSSGFKRLKQRKLYLFNDAILWTSVSETKPKVHGFIQIFGTSVSKTVQRRSNGRESAFVLELMNQGEKHLLLFGKRDERDTWGDEVEQCINTVIANRKQRNTGTHCEKDFNQGISFSPSRSYSSLSKSSKISVVSSKASNESFQPQSSNELVTCICFTLGLYIEEFKDYVLLIDESITNLIKHDILNALEYFLFRLTIPVQLNENVLEHLIPLLEPALHSFKDEQIEVPYLNENMYDLEGLPVMSNSWGERLLVCLMLIAENSSKQDLRVDLESVNMKVQMTSIISLGIFRKECTSDNIKKVIEIAELSIKDRRMIECCVWTLLRLTHVTHCWDSESRDQFLSFLSKASSKFVLSLESDVKALRNMALAMKYLSSAELLSKSPSSDTQLIFVNLTKASIELKHFSTLKILFNALAYIASTTHSSTISAEETIPIFVEALPESQICLKIIASHVKWAEWSLFSGPMMERSMQLKVHELSLEIIRAVPSRSFLSFCVTHNAGDWIIRRINSQHMFAQTVITVSARMIEEMSKSDNSKFTNTIQSICSSLIRQIGSCKLENVEFTVNLCQSLTKCILSMGSRMNSLSDDLFTNLFDLFSSKELWNHKITSESARKQVVTAILYCFSAFMESGLISALGNHWECVLCCIDSVFNRMRQYKAIIELALMLLGDLITIKKTQVTNEVVGFLPLLLDFLKSKDQVLTESVLYVFREFAIACASESNEERTKVLSFLISEGRPHILSSLSSDNAPIRMKSMLFMLHAIISMKEAAWAVLAADDAIERICMNFPIRFNPESHESVEHCFEENCLVYQSLDMLISSNSQNNSYNRLYKALFSRIPHIVEYALEKAADGKGKSFMDLASLLLSSLRSSDKQLYEESLRFQTTEHQRMIKLLQ